MPRAVPAKKVRIAEGERDVLDRQIDVFPIALGEQAGEDGEWVGDERPHVPQINSQWLH